MKKPTSKKASNDFSSTAVFDSLVERIPLVRFVKTDFWARVSLGTHEARLGLDSELKEADEDKKAEVRARRITRAVETLLRDAPPHEKARFRAIEKAALERGSIEGDGAASGWLVSFHLWGRFLEAGEESVFINLSPYLKENLAFYLRQWWVSELISKWCRAGEDRKITRLLFGGTPGRGNHWQTRHQNYYRDQRIVRRLSWWREVKKVKPGEAISRVTDEVKTGLLGIGEVVSRDKIQGLYYKHIGRRPHS